MIVSSRPKRARAGQYVLLVFYMLFLAFPLLWLLSVSFKSGRELVELHPSLIPSDPTLQNYREALSGDIGIGDVGLLHAAWNSFKVASLTSLLSAVADAAGSDTNATTCLHAADTVDAADEPAAPTLAIGPFGMRSESMKNGDAPATAIAATVTTASLLLERMS